MKHFSLVTIQLITGLVAVAQNGRSLHSQMDNAMRDNGMIWVVVAVLLLIFGGLIVFLIRIDRKMSKIENQWR
jgi:hypothetical protein